LPFEPELPPQPASMDAIIADAINPAKSLFFICFYLIFLNFFLSRTRSHFGKMRFTLALI
jgi:hypothetical protein